MPSLVIDKVVKDYGAYRAIKGVSLAVEEGEFLVMVGPSGCGKSTLLARHRRPRADHLRHASPSTAAT